MFFSLEVPGSIVDVDVAALSLHHMLFLSPVQGRGVGLSVAGPSRSCLSTERKMRPKFGEPDK